MAKDKHDILYWNMESPPMGGGFWPTIMGHLTGYGESHYSNPLPHYFCPHVIVKGQGTVHCCGQNHSVRPGDMFSLWPGQAIEYFEDPDDTWEFIWVQLKGTGTSSFLHACGFNEKCLVLRPVNPEKVQTLFREIYSKYSNRDYADIPSIISAFYELPAACRNLSHQPEDTGAHDIVEQAAIFIESMLNTPLDVNQISENLGVCRTTLYRSFIKKKGMTPIEYLSQVRIGRAKRLLNTTNLTIAKISQMVGFTESHYFLSFFRKHTGITPGEYRKKLRTN